MGANRSLYRPHRALQPRELEALTWLGQGWPLKAIAYRMRIGEGTVKVYLHYAYRSLGLDQLPERSCRALAVRWVMARQLGLPRSTADTRRARLLADLCLPPDPPEPPPEPPPYAASP